MDPQGQEEGEDDEGGERVASLGSADAKEELPESERQQPESSAGLGKRKREGSGDVPTTNTSSRSDAQPAPGQSGVSAPFEGSYDRIAPGQALPTQQWMRNTSKGAPDTHGTGGQHHLAEAPHLGTALPRQQAQSSLASMPGHSQGLDMNQLMHLQRSYLASGAMGPLLQPGGVALPTQIPTHPGSARATISTYSVATTVPPQHDSYASVPGGTADDVAASRARAAASTEVGSQLQEQQVSGQGNSLFPVTGTMPLNPQALQQYYQAMFGPRSGMPPSMIVPPASFAGQWPSDITLQQQIQQFQGQVASETLMRQLLTSSGGDAAARMPRQPPISNIATFLPQPLPVTLYQHLDQEALSDYQCLVRKCIEVFTANMQDVEAGAQGRNRKVVVGQVGIRCIHCRFLHPGAKSRGAAYYPSKLTGVYQAAQNMASAHLVNTVN